MSKELKQRLSFTLTKENVDWLRNISEISHIPMSLFMDSMLSGIRAASDSHASEREAMAIAFEQVAKGMRG
jgi:nucleosome binding factor SPN SPT16 subunit